MTREFIKKRHVLLSYVAKGWFEYHALICSRIDRVFHTWLNLSSSVISRSKLHEVNRIVIRVIRVPQYIGYYSKRLLYSLITIRERPQSLFQFLLTIAACLVIVSIINQSQLSANYIDYKLYSATTEHNQNDGQSNLYTPVKQIDNKTTDTEATDLGNKRLSEQLDLKENAKERQDSLNTIKIPMNDNKVIRDVTVAILDTGIDHKHEDLSGMVVDEIDFTRNCSPVDRQGHGTHIAGIIAADADNCLGLIGVAPQAKLLNVKVADDIGMCKRSVVAAGIVWAVDNGADVINISLEMREGFTDLEDAVNYAWENGCVIVAAANTENEPLVYPANYENCIAVTVNREENIIIPLASNGHWVDIAAPGTKIYSTLPNDSYGIRSGASCSTAFVSGIAALLFSTLDDDNGDGKLNDEVRIAIENNYFDISWNAPR